jgi:integrase
VFLATGGLRMGEALDISVGQASAEYLSVHRTKSARPRTIPLIPAIERAIAARITQLAPGTSDKARLWHEIEQIDEPLPLRWSWIVINRALSLKYRIHDLRHTAISNLFLYTDLRDQEIAAISGHLSSEILARYAHLRTAKLAERASAIGADLI